MPILGILQHLKINFLLLKNSFPTGHARFVSIRRFLLGLLGYIRIKVLGALGFRNAAMAAPYSLALRGGCQRGGHL